MDVVRIGDLKVSPIGIGAWQAGFRSWGRGYTKEDLIDAYRYAFDHGVNLIDTAEIYGNGLSEEIVGEAIRGYSDIIVATKVAGFNVSRGSMLKSVERSRRRLGVDAIDLYQLHWPPSVFTDLCKVIRNMERLIDKGLVRHIGVSNFDERLLDKALKCLKKYEIVSNQIQYSLVFRYPDKALRKYMEDRGIALIAYSPLGKGVLAGKTKADNAARRMDRIFNMASKDSNLQDLLGRLSEKYGVSKASISLRWLIDKGAIPIPGVKNRNHVNSILDAMELRISGDDMAELDRATAKYINISFPSVAPRLIPNMFIKFVIGLMRGV